MEENEILGFDPSQLSVFNESEAPKSTGNNLIYRTRPIDVPAEIDENHIYRCTIKIVYNPFKRVDSILEQQSYWLEDAEGGFSVVSPLTVNDKNCPIFNAWKKCHYANPSKAKTPEERAYLQALWAQAAPEKDQNGNTTGGHNVFDKRFARYCVVQILDDKVQPELVNRFMLMKVPKVLWEMISSKTHPTTKDKAPRPVMDFLFGNAIELEVKPGPGKPGEQRYSRETTYTAEWSDDYVPCRAADGSSLLNDDELEILDKYVSAMKKVWKEKDEATRIRMTNEIASTDNFKQLQEIYKRVVSEIKEVCPNLVETLGYKAWDEKTTQRVNNWIKIVLEGNDPKTATTFVGVTNNIVSTPTASADPFDYTEESATSTVNPITDASADDDLPF